MDRLKTILKESSLSSTLADIEIDELVEEIRDDFEDYLEEEKERIEEEAGVDELNDEIETLKEKIDEQQEELRELRVFKGNSLNDQITSEWIKANWEQLTVLQQMNLNGEEILNKFCKC